MKIHTTQNLNSLGRMKSTDSSTIPNEEIRLNYSEHMRKQSLSEQPKDTYESSVSFKGKKEIVKVVQKAADKETTKDKFLKSRLFDKALDLMGHEVLVQAIISSIVCMLMRPITIMALPTKKNKQDNIYASAHSISSGAAGIVASVIIATPFTKGIKYAQKNLLKEMETSILQKKYPNLDINSIWADSAHKVRKDVHEWKDIFQNTFSPEYKNTSTIARPKLISEVSEKTLQDFGINVDLNAMKGKSVNNWVDKNGKKIHIPLKDMFLAVKEEGMGGSLKGYADTNFFSLQHIDKDFLKELMPKLDINSIEKDGQRVHTDFWKTIDGKKFDIDLDMIHLSSFKETSKATPLYTGAKRANNTKYVAYQSNVGKFKGVPDKLGTPVDDKMLNADKANEISNKWLSWLPDIATRIPVAAGTIMLIPLVLKNVFHLEKSKKPDIQKESVVEKHLQESATKDNVIPTRKEVA